MLYNLHTLDGIQKQQVYEPRSFLAHRIPFLTVKNAPPSPPDNNPNRLQTAIQRGHPSSRAHITVFP